LELVVEVVACDAWLDGVSELVTQPCLNLCVSILAQRLTTVRNRIPGPRWADGSTTHANYAQAVAAAARDGIGTHEREVKHDQQSINRRTGTL
jgi:hypothetical protein